MHAQVLRSLHIGHASLLDQAHSLKLELARKLPSLHDPPPAPSKHLTRCLRSRVQASAAEQKDQLRRYRRLLEEEANAYSTRLLIFLSPRKYPSPLTGKPDICLTYEGDIWPWLSAIEPSIQAIHLRGVLQQYCRIVRNMDGEDAMGDRRNQELIDLVKQQENILCALEISDSIEDVKNALRLSFWEHIDADLRSGLSES